MKSRKLLVRVGCTKRNFYLFRPKDRSDWHIQFAPPSWVRAQLGRQRVCRSTQTSEIEPARRIAAQIIESMWKDAGDSAEAAGLTSHSSMAIIGDVLDRYTERAEERPNTVARNAQALRMLVRVATKGEADGQPVRVLTGELVSKFEQSAEMSRISIASYVTQAKSVVAPRKMRFYDGLKLPDLTSFRAATVKRPEVTDLVPPDMNALRAMDAAAPKLSENDPASYVAHLLFSRLALRNSEILNARESWIADGRIGIIKRPAEDFRPKGRSGWLPIAPDLLAEILRFRHLCNDGYLVPGANKTERHNAIYRRHSAWVSKWVRGTSKTSYELRRYAGSRLLDMGATLMEVRDFLRHRDIQTTQRWYAYRLENRELPTIGLTNLVPTAKVA